MYFEVTTGIVAIAVVSWLYLGPYAWLRREAFRSDVRKFRDELFDFIWQNGLSFDDPAYRECRTAMNSILKASNVLSPVYLLIAFWMSPAAPKPKSRSDSTQLQAAIDAANRKMAERTLKFLFLEGLSGLCLYSVMGLLRGFRVVLNLPQMVGDSLAGLEVIAGNSVHRDMQCRHV